MTEEEQELKCPICSNNTWYDSSDEADSYWIVICDKCGCKLELREKLIFKIYFFRS